MKEMDRPLNSTWDVYYLRNDVGANWDDRLVKVASFGTILEFWAVYLYLKLPNQLQAVSIGVMPNAVMICIHFYITVLI